MDDLFDGLFSDFENLNKKKKLTSVIEKLDNLIDILFGALGGFPSENYDRLISALDEKQKELEVLLMEIEAKDLARNPDVVTVIKKIVHEKMIGSDYEFLLNKKDFVDRFRESAPHLLFDDSYISLFFNSGAAETLYMNRFCIGIDRYILADKLKAQMNQYQPKSLFSDSMFSYSDDVVTGFIDAYFYEMDRYKFN